MKSRTVVLLAVAGLLLGFVSPVLAQTYYGPSFATPAAISPGGTINIVLSTGSGPGIVPLPQGSSTPCSGNCVYPQQPWTTATSCFYSIHEVTVTDPSGNEYMLGSSVMSGLYWPAAYGGSGSGTSVPPQADALNVTVGDSFTIPFAAGAGGFSFTSVLGNPPNDVSPAGPYYWWTVAGNTYGSNLRLDQNPSINPTVTHGMYTADVEGNVICPVGSTPFTANLFFDAGIITITPQFPLSIAFVTVSGVLVLALIKRSRASITKP
jgi:hypothetical protein